MKQKNHQEGEDENLLRSWSAGGIGGYFVLFNIHILCFCLWAMFCCFFFFFFPLSRWVGGQGGENKCTTVLACPDKEIAVLRGDMFASWCRLLFPSLIFPPSPIPYISRFLCTFFCSLLFITTVNFSFMGPTFGLFWYCPLLCSLNPSIVGHTRFHGITFAHMM